MSLRTFGFSPPRMITPASSRSSAVSTAVTNAGAVRRAPRRVPAERLPVPLLEVGETGLGRERARLVVDPVPRELARADQLEAARAVGVDRERERRPHERRAELHERRMRSRAAARAARCGRRRSARTSRRRASRLGSSRSSGSSTAAKVMPLRPSWIVVAPIIAAGAVARVDDPAALDLDPAARGGSRSGTGRSSRSASRSGITSGGGSS